MMAYYNLLAPDFSYAGEIELDIYRDIFVVSNYELHDFIKTSKYRPLYVYSYYVNGVVLKINKQIDAFFKKISIETNYIEDAQKLFDGKISWYKEITEI